MACPWRFSGPIGRSLDTVRTPSIIPRASTLSAVRFERIHISEIFAGNYAIFA